MFVGRTSTVRLHLPWRERPCRKGPHQLSHCSSRVFWRSARYGMYPRVVHARVLNIGDLLPGSPSQHLQRSQQTPRLPSSNPSRKGSARLALRHQSPPSRSDQIQVCQATASEQRQGGKHRHYSHCGGEMRYDRYGIRVGLLREESV